MALIHKAVGTTFTDTSLPLLQRDAIANNGTVAILDALDTYSWSTQAAPTTSDTWQNLIDGGSGATFTSAIGWSDGFTMDNTADIITLPSHFKPGASDSRVLIFWVKIGTQTATTGNGIIAWTGTSAADCQFLCYLDHNTTDATTIISMFNANAAAQILTVAVSTLPASRVAQIAVSMEPEAGSYRFKAFVNGTRRYSGLRASATLSQPAASCRLGGTLGGYTDAFVGTHLRCVADDLSVMTADDFVAADYAAYSSRFS